MENIRQELKSLIVSSLRLTETKPEDLADDQSLIGGDLGVDSIDILQLVVDIEKKFGIQLVGGKFDGSAWESIRTLAAAIEARMLAGSEQQKPADS